MSVCVARIRDDVVDALNSAGLAPAIDATPAYDIAFNLANLTGGRLIVLPQTKGPALLMRSGPQKNDCKLDVGIQYKFTTPEPDQLDPYLALAERIPDLFLGKPLSKTSAVCVEASYPHGLFLQEHIEKFRVFTSVVTLSFIFDQ